MSAKRDREEEIFDTARELAAEDRAAYLAERCGQDADLRQRIEGMLEADAAAGEFFKTHDAPSPTADASLSPSIEKAGDRIGRYKLLQQIGEGGMGLVYMAEQDQPVRRSVALKIIKLGMDTRQVVARFEAERQALAIMNHPHIAKVFDAGATDSGRPYFVMELVRGVPITEYCDKNCLATRQRLELFILVCQAVQHAHQKGIIHRDLKPSNILVTSNDGVPWPMIIDFGIAKATHQRLTEKTLFTNFAQMIGTPAYMSPEQAEMSKQDVDTRTDIYALGVLLYELLTGSTPFPTRELLSVGYREMQRIIAEKEPLRLSVRLTTMANEERTVVAKNRSVDAGGLAKQFRGDLDWIAMKCLEKDRARRYDTANGLAADIQRHLGSEPVSARPPTHLYRLQKLVRRNKLVFAAAGALVMMLLLGVIGSTWQAMRATRAEREQIRLREAAETARANEAKLRAHAEVSQQKAEAEAARSTQVAAFMTLMLEGAGPRVAVGRDATLLREILQKTSNRIGAELTNQPEVQGDLWDVLGRTYADIGDPTNAIVSYRESLKSYRQAFQGNHAKLAIALGNLGSAQSFCQQIKEGTNNAGLGLQMARALGDEKTLATCLSRYAHSLGAKGKAEPAGEPYLREAATIRQKFGTNDSLMSTYNALASTITNHSEAHALTRQVLSYYLYQRGEDHPDTAYQRFSLGQHLLNSNRASEAADELAIAMAAWRKLFPPNHPHRHIVVRYFIQSLVLQKKYQEAETEIELERRLFPTNDYCASIGMALKISKGEWPIAPTNILTMLESNLNPSSVSFNTAIMLARTGRMNEYRRCCERLMSRAEKQRDFTNTEQAAKVALLFPADAATVEAAGKLADFATTAETTDKQWAWSTKALAEYRRGNLLAAIEFANRSLAAKSLWRSVESTAYSIQALAYAGLGDKTKARTVLNQIEPAALKYREQTVMSPWEMIQYWGHRDWIMADILKREAEALLEPDQKPRINSAR